LKNDQTESPELATLDHRRDTLYFACLAVFCALIAAIARSQTASTKEPYLTWTESLVDKIGKSTRINGTVGGLFDFRIIHTEHAYNYKLRATWMTPEVIRASARLEQLRMRLTDDQTRELVSEAEEEAETVILVEIDPREGSGVIPLDWRAILQPVGLEGGIVGRSAPDLKAFKALGGVARRDYAYDVFWVVFPLIKEDGESMIPDSVKQVELHVGIYNKQGKVRWNVPDSIRQRIKTLSDRHKR
jgi:hypothetical protein